MRRAFISVCAVLGLVLMLAGPALAWVGETREKSDGKLAGACGNSNGFSLWSWVEAEIGPGADKEVRYNAKPNDAAYLDLRLWPSDPDDLESITVDIWKRQADGTGKVNHYHVKRWGSPGWAGSQELFEFAAVNNIQRNRHPWLEVDFDWTDGSCGSKTAWDNDWLP